MPVRGVPSSQTGARDPVAMLISTSSMFRCTLITAGALFTLTTTAHGVEARVLRIDGTTLRGQWAGFESSPGAALLLSDGADRHAVRLCDIASVAVGAPSLDVVRHEASGQDSATLFHLADGAQLSGRVTGWDDDTLIAQTVISNETRLPIDRLAAVQWLGGKEMERANELFRAALRDRLPGQDVLITADPVEPKVLRGRVARIDAESGSFILGGQTRTFATGKAYAVVFAAGASKQGSAGARLELRDGSSVGGRMIGGGDASVRLETSFGLTTELPLSAIERIEVRSDRVTYVSDLDPAESRSEGRLHNPWPVRRNKCVNGAPLVIEGRRFENGIGMHSLSEVSYVIGPDYESFAATIGLDDAVRPRGSVEFRVLGDGKLLYKSGLLTGRDQPRDILVSVQGVGRLTLIVDYGDELDLADYADWGGARLLRASVQ